MEKSELEKLKPEELINLSETNTSEFRWNRSNIYNVLFEKYEKSSEKEKLEDIKKEILIFDLSTLNLSEKRFKSMVSGISDEGNEWKYPDLEKHFPEEVIEYYKSRANITNNPILKSRYSDVVWELDKNVNFARLAVRAYLDCCPIYFTNEWDYELADSLDRAITVALMIKDLRLIDESLKKHYEFIQQLVDKSRFRYLLEIIGSILNQEKRISDQIDYDHLISIIESAIVDYTQNVTDSFNLQRSFMELLVKIWQLRKNQDEQNKIKVRIAESFIEEAEWKKINYPSGNAVAASFYEDAMQAYLDLGIFPEKVTELKTKIQEANEAALKTEYKTISAKVKIPRQEIDDYLKMYEGLETTTAFQIMSLDESLIPSYKRSKEEAIEQTTKFVMQHIFPVTIMKGNICVKHISEEDEKLECSTIRNFQMSYRMTAHMLLNEVFALLEKENTKYVESLAQYLSSSGIIDDKRIEIIKHGLRAYKDKEYLASIHILVFQIEGILRDLLGKLGLPTFSYRSNEIREIMLSNILVTLSQIEGMDKDFLKYIEIYLCDIRGDNYRNNIAHGLLSLESYTKENTQMLLLILIKLASYNVVKINEIKEA
ncbi:MAG: protein of unknown function (DUF4209) [Candidatus Methanomarinus sp.]|nr:MAG: protein of unknown function (DUF4209) [ANME-2 cluster archaeon]